MSEKFSKYLLVFRFMKKNGMRSIVKKKFIAITQSKHNFHVARKHLNRKFGVKTTDTVWLSDITYVRTLEGWVYMALVMDLYNRKIVIWTCGKHLKKELMLKDLSSALEQHQPHPGLDALFRQRSVICLK
jgi:putative transposase